MTPSLSVIICTYNPNKIVFTRCIKSIVAANNYNAPFEILVIDNNSTNNFEKDGEISLLISQLGARIIHETEQGLTPARLRGIKEAIGEVLIFIDDDNLLEKNYFEVVKRIANTYPFIGAWSGQVQLEFETTPEEWTKRYWGMLVYRELTKDVWSNLPHLGDTTPTGAGLCVRKEVAASYLTLHEAGKRNIQLDRSAGSLMSGGDNDLAACACDIGLGVGLFKDQKLVHIIPGARLSKKYLLNLANAIATSSVIFKSFRGELTPGITSKKRFANYLRQFMMTPIERQFFTAVNKGEEKGINILNQTKK